MKIIKSLVLAYCFPRYIQNSIMGVEISKALKFCKSLFTKELTNYFRFSVDYRARSDLGYSPQLGITE